MAVINSSGINRIVNIIPASGWWSKWQDKGEIIYNKLICFALIEYTEGKRSWEIVVGLDSCDDMIEVCEVMQNFKGYEYREREVEKLS